MSDNYPVLIFFYHEQCNTPGRIKINDIKYVCSLCPEIKKYIVPRRSTNDIQIDIMKKKERKKYKKTYTILPWALLLQSVHYI